MTRKRYLTAMCDASKIAVLAFYQCLLYIKAEKARWHYMTTGEKIQQYRKMQNLSQDGLAQQMLVSRQTVSQWENDQTLPSVDNLIRLRDIFGVTVDDLLCCQPWQVEQENPNRYSFQFREKELYIFRDACIERILFWAVLSAFCTITEIIQCIVKDELSEYGSIWPVILLAMIVLLFINHNRWKTKISDMQRQTFVYDIWEHYAEVRIYEGERLLRMRWIPYAAIRKCRFIKQHFILQCDNEMYLIPMESLRPDCPMKKALLGKIKK